MFLDALVRRNPAFVSAAISLQQEGAIPAAAYVLDLDAVEHNAGLIAAEAARLHLDVFAMTKQMGRNASFCRAAVRGGIASAVAVDMECARRDAAGMRLGHLGHLVQVPANARRRTAARSRTIGPSSTLRRQARRRRRAREQGVIRRCSRASSPKATVSIAATRAASPPRMSSK